MRLIRCLALTLALLLPALSSPVLANTGGDPMAGVGIHPEDFKVFDLNGRILFVDDRAILRLIGMFEGPDGYDTMYYGSLIKPPRPITTMTISELLSYQDRSVEAGSKSSAAGMYQWIRKSLRETVTKAGIPMDTVFDRFTQDRLARAALRNCGFYRHDVADEVIGNCLAGTWAALPVITGPGAGKSRYHGVAGNKSLTTTERVMSTIRGRFRDVAHAHEIRNFRGAPVQQITDMRKTATLVKERSAVTGEIVFSVSEPEQETIRLRREERRRESREARALRLQPFSGYVSKAAFSD